MLEKRYKNKKWYIIYKAIISTISWAVLTFLGIIGVILLLILVNTKLSQKKGETPFISLYTIVSPSMVPTINVYDVVVVKKTNAEELQQGDIISFYSLSEFFGSTPITHRINRKFNTTEGIKYETRGDGNKDADLSLVTTDRVVGKVIFKIPQLGRIQYFLVSKSGWLIALVIPALAIIIYDGFKIIKLTKIRKRMEQITVQEEKRERDEDLNIEE